MEAQVLNVQNDNIPQVTESIYFDYVIILLFLSPTVSIMIVEKKN